LLEAEGSAYHVKASVFPWHKSMTYSPNPPRSPSETVSATKFSFF
jgi:hypothetical protein